MALFMLRHGRRFPSTFRCTRVFSNEGVVLNRSSRTRLPPPSPVTVAAAAVRAFSAHGQIHEETLAEKLEVDTGPTFWIKSRIYYFLIKIFFHKDFSADKFIEGSKQLFSHVSKNLAEGKFHALEGLVDKDIVEQLKENYKQMPLHDRQTLAVHHIISAKPSQMEIYMDPFGRRFVKIQVHFYYLTAYDPEQHTEETHIFRIAGEEESGNKNLRIAIYEFRMALEKNMPPYWTIIMVQYSGKHDLESKL
ncbi:m-AAA protease-interacting protein 1, mitochondrial-like [Betta splendens]|uniref:M-AAA protease-interacting protein 1, mitochondrial-like n=1 Tax=Betta splendens TaxID=158456 RepID=A0A6P7LBC0_BETSP|nr:m-AAA protease-interacting protein 1, mitochondrial-like [Betta splendens]